jgi:hypothetical protein
MNDVSVAIYASVFREVCGKVALFVGLCFGYAEDEGRKPIRNVSNNHAATFVSFST